MSAMTECVLGHVRSLSVCVCLQRIVKFPGWFEVCRFFRVWYLVLIGKNPLWSVFINLCFNVNHDVSAHLYKIMMLKWIVVHVTRFVMSEIYVRMFGVNHVFKMTNLYHGCNFETCYVGVILGDPGMIGFVLKVHDSCWWIIRGVPGGICETSGECSLR